MRAMPPFEILLVDDHALLRSGRDMVRRCGMPNGEVLQASARDKAMRRALSAGSLKA